MKNQKARQMALVWKGTPHPISVPEKTRIILVDILAEMLSTYWAKSNYCHHQRKDDKK